VPQLGGSFIKRAFAHLHQASRNRPGLTGLFPRATLGARSEAVRVCVAASCAAANPVRPNEGASATLPRRRQPDDSASRPDPFGQHAGPDDLAEGLILR
jgi:hypothetical protein